MNLIKTFSKIHGYYGIYEHLLRDSQFWPEERKQEYMFEHLRRTLIRAAEGTSHYGKRFAEAEFNPRKNFQDPSDLQRIPLLSKNEVRSNPGSLTDRRYLAGSIPLHTSGTTGQPLTYRWSEYQAAFDSGCVFRHWGWSGYTFRSRMVALRSYVPSSEDQPLWRYSAAQNTMFFSAYHLTPKNCEQYIDEMLKFNPRYMKGYPSSIALLAEYAYPVRERFGDLRGIYTASETLLPSEREVIEATFGRRLFNWYGMGEPAIVLTECERHEGMHVNWEYGYPEFLPSDDLSPDEYRLVTTSFHNPVMPFIRYDTGDVVRLFKSPPSCSCGRNMPLLHSVVGRKDECIITPDARRLPSVNFYTVFREHSEIVKWQLVQYGRSEVVAKIAVRERCDRIGLERRLLHDLRLRTGTEVDVSVDFTDRFVTNSDGKTLPVLRKLAARSIEEKEEYTISSQRAWEMDRQQKEVYKLDWNEADKVPSPLVQQALARAIADPHSICWYPEANSSDLRNALGRYVEVNAQNVVLSHGSDAAMELIATSFVRPGDKVLIIYPTYDNFRAVVEQRGGEILRFAYNGSQPFPLAEFISTLRGHSPRLVYFTNPNNPIGYLLEKDTLQRLFEVCMRLSTILVIDEAYCEFAGSSLANLAATSECMMVLRTLSKAFGLAGLRLGYIVAGSGAVKVLQRTQNPKSVTTFAKEAAMAAIEDADHMRGYVAEVRRSRERLCAFLDQRRIRYYPSHANFVLLQCDTPQELVGHLESRGILVRDRTQYFDGVGHVRITVGGTESTDASLRALDEFFAELKAGQGDTEQMGAHGAA